MNKNEQTTQFVSDRELMPGDRALLSGKVWVVTSRVSVPDKVYPWLYYAELFNGSKPVQGVSPDRKVKAAGE